MKYCDNKGEVVDIETSQDELLKKIYGSVIGRFALKILTLPAISKMAGKFLDSKISCMLISPFIRKNNIKLSDYEKTRYRSYNEFFTRQIKSSLRPVDFEPSHLISPCDGNVMIYPIRRSSHFMVKNTIYTLRTILNDKKLAAEYQNGYCFVIRLCVDNYHRYCYIDNGTKSGNEFIKGRLHTVNPIANDYYPIYKENSREYSILHTDNFGDVVQIEVGALMVGRILNYHQEADIKRGQEKGRFEFGGSTIVLLVKQDANINIRQDIIENSIMGIETKIKMGELLGTK